MNMLSPQTGRIAIPRFLRAGRKTPARFGFAEGLAHHRPSLPAPSAHSGFAPRRSGFLSLLTLTLVVVAASSSFGQSAVFYRVTSTNETAIVSFDRNQLLTCSNSVANAPCVFEMASTVEGPWTSHFCYTVVRAADQEMVALMASGLAVLPTKGCWDAGPVGQVRDSILVGGTMCRMQAAVWRDLMPGPTPPRGVNCTVRVTGTAGPPIPPSAVITWVWVFTGSQLWEVPFPRPTGLPAANVIDTTVSGGPTWSSGTRVDVLVQVTLDNVNYLLRVNHVPVEYVY